MDDWGWHHYEKRKRNCFQYTLGSLFMDHLLGTVRCVNDTWEIFAATSITIMDQIFLLASKNSNFSSAHVWLPTPYILMYTLWLSSDWQLSLTTLLNNGEWLFNLWLCLSTSLMFYYWPLWPLQLWLAIQENSFTI